MYKVNNLKPFSYSSNKKNFESNIHAQRKNPNLSQDKIYFFRTSLFTEKSKNFILKLHSCEKNKSTFNSSNITNEITTPKINTIIQTQKTSIKLKKGKIFLSQNKNQNKSDIEESQNSIIKEKKEYTRNPTINKSSNNLINPSLTKNISQAQIDNKSVTIDKKSSNKNQDKDKNVHAAIKNLKQMKKEKIFTPLNNIINTNNNKQTLILNYINQNHSIINLANAKTRQKQITKDKTQKIETTYKIKYRLKSQKNSDKKEKGKNIISFRGLKNNNLQKDLKNLKPINHNYDIKPSSIFDENYYISKYKLGNFYAKKNNRYGIIRNNFIANNNMKSTMITNEKNNSKKRNQNNLYKRNIFI